MKKILLIEPDAKSSKIISDYLTTKGLNIVIAESSQQAIDLCDQQKPDLIILELAIHDQNGIAFLHELRSYQDWVKIPVIVHTKLPLFLNKSDKTLDSLNVNNYLYKPETSLKKLESTIFKVFSP